MFQIPDLLLRRGLPSQNSRRYMVSLPQIPAHLKLEVGQRIAPQEIVGPLLVIAVAALNLTVVSWGVRPDQFMLDAQAIQSLFKAGKSGRLACNQAVGKFRAVVSLDALNEVRELLDAVRNELSG